MKRNLDLNSNIRPDWSKFNEAQLRPKFKHTSCFSKLIQGTSQPGSTILTTLAPVEGLALSRIQTNYFLLLLLV